MTVLADFAGHSHDPNFPLRRSGLHIPDGFLRVPVSILYWIVMLAFLWLAMWWIDGRNWSG